MVYRDSEGFRGLGFKALGFWALAGFDGLSSGFSGHLCFHVLIQKVR